MICPQPSLNLAHMGCSHERVSRVNYIGRMSSISFAGSPPLPGPAAGLLAGESSCEWSAWFRAHYQDWARAPSDFNSTQRMLDYTALVNQARESWERLGYEVFTENQNSFRLRGRSGTVAGKPDLIAVKGNNSVMAVSCPYSAKDELQTHDINDKY